MFSVHLVVSKAPTPVFTKDYLLRNVVSCKGKSCLSFCPQDLRKEIQALSIPHKRALPVAVNDEVFNTCFTCISLTICSILAFIFKTIFQTGLEEKKLLLNIIFSHWVSGALSSFVLATKQRSLPDSGDLCMHALTKCSYPT